MSNLPPDIWTEVVPHLPPRHAYKLMRVSRALQRTVDEHRVYWARVALHLVWREVMWLHPWAPASDEQREVKRVELARDKGLDRGSLQYLVGLPRGYKAALDALEALVNRCVRMGGDDDDSGDEPDAPPAPLADLLSLGIEKRVRCLIGRFDDAQDLFAGPVACDALDLQAAQNLYAARYMPDPKTQARLLVWVQQCTTDESVRRAQRLLRQLDDWAAPLDLKRRVVARLQAAFHPPRGAWAAMDPRRPLDEREVAFAPIRAFVRQAVAVRDDDALADDVDPAAEDAPPGASLRAQLLSLAALVTAEAGRTCALAVLRDAVAALSADPPTRLYCTVGETDAAGEILDICVNYMVVTDVLTALRI